MTAAVSAHDKDINAVAVSPNDAFICTASQDRTAKVRQIEFCAGCSQSFLNKQMSMRGLVGEVLSHTARLRPPSPVFVSRALL